MFKTVTNHAHLWKLFLCCVIMSKILTENTLFNRAKKIVAFSKPTIYVKGNHHGCHHSTES